MKIHFISNGYAVALAYQSKLAGSKVTVHIPNSQVGNGMFSKVAEAMPPSKTDAVVVDGIGWGKIVDEFKTDGRRVLFGGKFTELMNHHPHIQKRIAEEAGFESVPEDAIVKPYKLIVGGWFEKGWRKPYYMGIVHDRLLAGDLGVSSLPVSAQVEPIEEGNHLVESFLKPLTDILQREEYAGLVSVSLVSHCDTLYVGSIMIGIQPQVIEAVSEMVKGGFPTLISECGAESDGDCAASIAISAPMWPSTLIQPSDPVIINIDKGQSKHFWPMDVKLVDNNLVYCMENGVYGSVTARGRALRPVSSGERAPWSVRHREATYRCYKTLEHMPIDGMQYRNDLGKDTDKLLLPLKEDAIALV